MATAPNCQIPKLPRVGEILDGRFELLGVLGEGGMGYVFRARDLRYGHEVALKLLTPRYLGRSDREERFLREFELGTRSEYHRHLVEYLESGRLRRKGWPYLVMRLVLGRDLASRLVYGALETPLAMRVARQLAGAIRALHRAGVVHRDVTPMNILFSEGDIVLIDLSHAAEVAAPQPAPSRRRLTKGNEVPGTQHFMAPEQARAEPAHPTMDVYAFGVVLVHMFTGSPTSGFDREAFIELQREGKVPPPRIDTRVYTEVPSILAELVDACTGAEPERRPTMDEVVQRLDALMVVMQMSGEVSSPLPAANGAGRRVSTEPHRASVPEKGDKRARPRPRWLSGLAVLLAFGVLVTFAGLWSSERKSDNDVVSQRENALAAVESSSPMSNPESRQGVTAEPAPSPKVQAQTAAMEVSGAPIPTIAPVEEPPVARAQSSQGQRHTRPERARLRPKDTDPCDGVVPRAVEARNARRWAKVAQLTRSPACWDDVSARTRLRIKALSELRRHRECAKLGEISSNPEVKRLATHCALRLDQEAP